MASTKTGTEPARQYRRSAPLLGLALLAASCAAPPTQETAPPAESWAVTAWGPRYEVFPEVDQLTAGETAMAHTHVTRLESFEPLQHGKVEIVLVGASGELVFGADEPVRPGIFNVEILPDTAGDFDLTFRISGDGGSEEIRGGRVRVGTPQQPGGLVIAPAPKGATDGGGPIAFLKEEQWRSDFATAWVRTDSLARSVSGLARLRPPAGGEAWVSSPVDGVLRPPSEEASWPFTGRQVDRGASLFLVVPRIAADRSLSALEADLTTIAAEWGAARARLARLETLLALEATSRREIEEARSQTLILEARRTAAANDLGAARSSREGGTAGGLAIRAPFRGTVAAVAASPGATVAAGEPLARLVRTDRLWLEIALDPAAARQLTEGGIAGVVLTASDGTLVRIEDGLRLVSVAPEISPSTALVTVLLAAPARTELTLGRTMEAQVLLSERRQGVVIPASALVDDAGVPSVYLQLSGESFIRQQVDVRERQGDSLLIDGLAPGQRLVTRGGEAIRRSSLLATGTTHGHVH